MKKLALLLLSKLVVFSSLLNAQDVNYGLSISSGFEVISNGEEVIRETFKSSYFDYEKKRDHPKQGLWMSHSLSFDVDIKNWCVVSLGLTSFNFAYNRDSISKSIVHGTMSQLDSIYTTTHYGYLNARKFSLAPTLSISKSFEINNRFDIQPYVSFSFPKIYENNTYRHYAYEPIDQEILSSLDSNPSGWIVDKTYYNIRISSYFNYKLHRLYVGTGPSLFILHFIHSPSILNREFNYYSMQWNFQLGFRF